MVLNAETLLYERTFIRGRFQKELYLLRCIIDIKFALFYSLKSIELTCLWMVMVVSENCCKREVLLIEINA